MSRNTNNISNIIQCPICQCTMKNATILYPTGQTYCFECIFECLEIYPNKGDVIKVVNSKQLLNKETVLLDD